MSKTEAYENTICITYFPEELDDDGGVDSDAIFRATVKEYPTVEEFGDTADEVYSMAITSIKAIFVQAAR